MNNKIGTGFQFLNKIYERFENLLLNTFQNPIWVENLITNELSNKSFSNKMQYWNGFEKIKKRKERYNEKVGNWWKIWRQNCFIVLINICYQSVNGWLNGLVEWVGWMGWLNGLIIFLYMVFYKRIS